MAMTALERKALFKSAVTLHELTMAEAAEQLGVSYNHLMLVLRGDRVGSVRLEQGIAALVGRPVRELFRGRSRGTAQRQSPRQLPPQHRAPGRGKGSPRSHDGSRKDD